MNYREKMRKAIECPQFGNINYGEWGTLRLDQRKYIKRLLDEMDSADEAIKHQYFEIQRLNNIINELEKYIKENTWYYNTSDGCQWVDQFKALDKLKELKEDKDE